MARTKEELYRINKALLPFHHHPLIRGNSPQDEGDGNSGWKAARRSLHVITEDSYLDPLANAGYNP